MARPIQPLRRPVAGVVRPPGSRSITNRALVAAALASGGVSRLGRPLEADDTIAMRGALTAFGVSVDDSDDPWLVLGSGGRLTAPATPVDVMASGTTARFAIAMAALAEGKTTIIGRDRLPDRPMGGLAKALARLGVEVTTEGGGLPAHITGGRLEQGMVEVDATMTSQFASALMLVAPLAAGDVEIRTSPSPVSAGYMELTVAVMREFGAEVEGGPEVYRVRATGYRKTELEVEPDASSAVYPLVAAAITGGSVLIEGLDTASKQPDVGVISVLERMGCSVQERTAGLALSGPPGGSLRPLDADLSAMPDAAVALAVAAVFATGPSRLRNLGTLRHKESDRLNALVTELGRVGVHASGEGADLVVVPGPARPGTIDSHSDHRIAMALAILGLRVPGISIGNPDVVTKTWPGFFDMLEAL